MTTTHATITHNPGVTMTHPKQLTLETLDSGALLEAVTAELKRICANIGDPNVSKTAKRKLRIDIEFKPDEKGTQAAINYSVKSTVPGPNPGKTAAYIAMAPGSYEVSLFEVEAHPKLFEEPPLPGIAPLQRQA